MDWMKITSHIVIIKVQSGEVLLQSPETITDILVCDSLTVLGALY